MNKLTTIFLILISNFIFAISPQLPDLLKIGNDTIYIYELPINGLTKSEFQTLSDNISKFENGIFVSTNLWRGFQAIWELRENQLYLTDIKDTKNSKIILKTSFPKKFKNGMVKADWFSDILVIPKDKMLKWDGVFSRTYKKEEILYFKKGNLTKRELVENYIDLKNGISRLEKDSITDKIFETIKELNWEKLTDFECDDEYYVTIGKKGVIDKVKFVPYLDSKWQNFWYAFSHRKCTRLIRKKLRELQFDIVKWNGKPYEDEYRIELFYDPETKKLENWTE